MRLAVMATASSSREFLTGDYAKLLLRLSTCMTLACDVENPRSNLRSNSVFPLWITTAVDDRAKIDVELPIRWRQDGQRTFLRGGARLARTNG